jgi:hypothetical protein
MIKPTSKLVWAASMLTLAASAYADIKLDSVNDHLTFSGYAAGGYSYYKADGAPAVDSLFDASKPVPGNGDANDVLLKFAFNYKPITTVVSLNYFPNLSSSEFSVLDAYVTYDAGQGVSITAGKFLSYLGYESFYPALMDQITYANGDFLAPIPGYHTGAKVDFTSNGSSIGVAAVDSVYSPYGGTRGDGELVHNAGFEMYYSYTGITNLTLWAGVAHDTKGNFQAHSVTTVDVWASYQLTKSARIAAEYVEKDGGLGAKGSNWLTFFNYSFTDTVSSAFRISGEKMSDGGPEFVKFTVAPAVAITPNLTVRAEYSYYDYDKYWTNKAHFFGVQAVFKF